MGFGLIYIPAVVSVAPYFKRKLALTTGIAVSGSGVGTFIFAPFSRYLIDTYDWKTALYVLAGIILTCGIFGMLMKPLATGSRFTGTTMNGDERNDKDEVLAEQGVRHRKEYIHHLADIGESRSSLQAIYYHRVPSTTNLELRNPTVIDFEDFDQIDREGLVPFDSTAEKSTDSPQSAASPTPLIDESGKQLNGYASVPTQPGVTPLRRRFLHDVLDISLLRKPAFILIALGNVFTMIGYFIPFVFIVDRAMTMNISESKAAFLISVIGKR